MLAFGWTIERTKEGDAFGIHACVHTVSQAGQVCFLTADVDLLAFKLPAVSICQSFLVFLSSHLKEHPPLALNLWT